jgi:hypothetical protein
MAKEESHSTLSGSADSSATAPSTESEVGTSVSETQASVDASLPSISDETKHAVRVACQELIQVSRVLSDAHMSDRMKRSLEVAAHNEAASSIIHVLTKEMMK